MGRRSHARALNIWMNGKLLGEWRLPARGQMELLYHDDWKRSAEARPLSLSFPRKLAYRIHVEPRMDRRDLHAVVIEPSP